MSLNSLLKRTAGRRKTRRLRSVCLALALVAAFLAPPTTSPLAAQELDAASARVRIGVAKDGITVVTPADLSNAGINPDTVDPRSFGMTSMGQPVSIYVTGEGDGRFDGSDRLYFFGQQFRTTDQMDQKYTDERAYWLDMGGAAGSRMGEVDATPQGNITPPTDFATTVHAEESLTWWNMNSLNVDTYETWFWAKIEIPALSATFPYTVPYPANKSATLRLGLIGFSENTAINPDHQTVALLNGQQVLDQTWDGMKKQKVLTASIPAGVLQHGQNGVNSLEVRQLAPPDVENAQTQAYFDYWEVDYRRLFRAYQDQLDFRAEVGGQCEYMVSGWSSADVFVWNVTNPNAPVRLKVPAASGSDLTLRFRANSEVPGNRYWLQGVNAAQAPASIRRRVTNLHQVPEGADSVIVTSAALRPQAERLANWHRQQGRRALVVDFLDAVDEFNDGIYHPRAVPAMLAYAVANWPAPAPAYLTLMGDGHWNIKGYNPVGYPPTPVHIPPYLAWVDPWQGEVAVDGNYGDIDGDNIPDIAVGRLAVNTLEEAAVVVGKIEAYDQGPRVADWQRRALFIADDLDPKAGDFQKVSDDIIAGYTPRDLTPVRLYLPPPIDGEDRAAQVAAFKTELMNALNAGAVMVQYTGHGARDRWTGESVLTTADIPAISNGPRLPVVMTFNCLDGYFSHARFPSMAETMHRLAGGGSIAAISPTGLGTTVDQTRFREILLTVMFKEDVRELGRALLITKQRFAAEMGRPHYLMQTITLFGDPALKIAGAGPMPELRHKLFLPTLNR